MAKRIRSLWTGSTAIGLLGGIVSVSAQQKPNPVVDNLFSDQSKTGSPGCALGIYRDGKVIYAKGYGLANLEENVAITPQSVFDVGSVSKQFTLAKACRKTLGSTPGLTRAGRLAGWRFS
jgi:CubicO group peptidase (beta-lactamase class C family)